MVPKLRLVIVGVAVGGLCLTVAFIGIRQASQPVVSCASAPKKSLTTPPTSPTTAQDYLALGDYDYEQRDCDKAITDYTHALELNPGYAEAYNNRAYVYMVQRDYASAVEDLDRAIELRPNYVNALMNRGDIHNYYYSIDYAGAVADYDQVLRIDPNAGSHTSVCGHRLLAMNHGWSPAVVVALAADGPSAGCPRAQQ